jgi:excisionase family DNA binding protein
VSKSSKQFKPVSKPPLDPEYSVKEVAAATGTSIDFIYSEIAKGNLLAHRYNARVLRIPLSALTSYRKAHRSVDAEPDQGLSV